VRLASGGALHVSTPATDGTAPVLFLHGVGGGAWSWEPQRDAFAADRPCYAWEARGHGLAARVADAGLGDYYVDACEAVDAVVARDGPAWVVGHSMGGLLAMALAAERPDAVCGVVLVDPVYAPDGVSGHGGPLAGLVRRAIGPFVGSIERGGTAARFVSRAVFRGSFLDRERMERAWKRQRTQVPVEYPKMLYEAFDGPTDFPNRAFACEIDRPTMLVEPLATQPRFPVLVAELERLGDRFTHVAFDGGHYLQLDRSAERVTRALVDFVNRWSR
jgi:pimeloyl-ACP methyl ester carboxylesterase